MSSMSSSEVGRSKGQSRPTSSITVALTRRCESTADVQAETSVVFDYLDDHARLSAHMSERSWMMAGSRMALELDAAEGRAVGSRIRLSGRVLGIKLWVDEVITERNPPQRKVWASALGKSDPLLLT